MEKNRIRSSRGDAMQELKIVQDLKKQLEWFNINKQFSTILILCIGTNKVVGDSIGPMVGESLLELLKYKPNVKIYGSMKEPLSFANTKQVLKEILIKYKQPFIITIDAALGKEEMIERIIVGRGNIKIGASLGRDASCNSHINIKAVVGKYKNDKMENFNTLINTDLKMVKKMADTITYGINQTIQII